MLITGLKKTRSILGCASNWASNRSISAGLQYLGFSPFLSDVVGGNVFSATHDIAASLLHGSGGGHSVYYNGAQAFFAGPALGFGGLIAKISPNAAEATGGFTDVAELVTFGAEAATGIAEAKLIYDAGTFAAGALFCLAGVEG